jgi:UDP-N-acetylglucosamine transferase subunit ALG13
VSLVVVTVGTDHHPFERMLDWVEQAQAVVNAEFVVQRGASQPRAGVDTFEYATSEELESLMRSAGAVVCHGGPGTISQAQATGHQPIVVPRNPALGEHVDDHQIRYTARLAAQGQIDLATDAEMFICLLSKPRPISDGVDRAASSAQAVRAFDEIASQVLDASLPPRGWRHRVIMKRTL